MKIRQKLRLLFGLLTGDTARTGPLFVAIDITRRCNLHCIGCHYHSPLLENQRHPRTGTENIKLELFENVCRQLRRWTPCEIIMIGEGEPFLHPDLIEMVRTAKGHGLSVRIATNGTLLHRPMVEQLVSAGLDRIDISLWAVTPEDAVHVYPKTGAHTFEKQMVGLSLLAETKARVGTKKPRVMLHQPISKHATDNIRGLIGIAERYGCDQVSFSPLRIPDKNLLEHLPSPELVKELHELREELRDHPLGGGLDPLLKRYSVGEDVLQHPCYVGWFHLRVDIDGMVSPCKMCTNYIGDFNTESIEDIWNGPAMKDFRRKGLAKDRRELLSPACECDFCCHLVSNEQIHRRLRWLKK